MRKILVALMAMVMALGVSAQSFDTSRLGVRLSIDAARPGDLSTGDGYTKLSIFGSGAGFSLGAVYKVDLTDNLFIEPGLGFYYNTFSINNHFLGDMIEDMLESIGADMDYKTTSRSVRRFGMRIPVMRGYTFPLKDDFSFRVFTGPMLDVGLSADMYYGMKIDGYDIHKAASLYGKNRMLNRVDCYWNIGAGVTFAEHYYLGLQADLGMCNMAKKSDGYKPSLHENVVQLSFGYNF